MNGYIYNFEGHGAFSPDGKVAIADNEIASHNRQLADFQIEAMKRGEPQALYLFGNATIGENTQVGTWDSSHKWHCFQTRHSQNNWGAKRIDVWFNFDGHTWHGVNIGDNDIVRCRRNKS